MVGGLRTRASLLKVTVPTICIAGSISTAALSLLPVSNELPYIMAAAASWVIIGIADALLLIGWLVQYRCTSMRNSIISICLSTLIAGAILAIACSLSGSISVIFQASLPIASALFLSTSAHKVPDTTGGATFKMTRFSSLPKTVTSEYLKIVVAIGAYGSVLGVLQAFSFQTAESVVPFEIRAAGICTGALMAFFVMLKPSPSREGAIYKIALPVTACGLLMIQLMGSSPSMAAFLILAGFSLFDVISVSILIRITLLYELPTIRALSIGRIANTAGIMVGQIVGHSLMNTLGISDKLVIVSSSILLLMLIISSGFLLDVKEPASIKATQTSLEDAPETDRARSVDRWMRQCELVSMQYGLSPREAEVLTLLSRGRDANYIATLFVISPHTAKTHIHNVYKKMGIHSQQTLIDIVEDAESQLKDK